MEGRTDLHERRNIMGIPDCAPYCGRVDRAQCHRSRRCATLNLFCPACRGARDCSLEWSTRGVMRIRAMCRTCKSFVKWQPRTPAAVAEAGEPPTQGDLFGVDETDHDDV